MSSTVNGIGRFVTAKIDSMSNQEVRDYMSSLSDYVIESYSLYEEFPFHRMDVLKDYINFAMLTHNQHIPEDIFQKYIDLWDWNIISYRDNLSEEFIIEHISRLNIEKVMERNWLSSEVLNTIHLIDELSK